MTEIILLPRQGGKTTRVLEWMCEAPEGKTRIFVSHSVAESNRVYRLAQAMGMDLERWQFVTAEWQRHRGQEVQFQLGVDNAELVLNGLLKNEIGAMSITDE